MVSEMNRFADNFGNMCASIPLSVNVDGLMPRTLLFFCQVGMLVVLLYCTCFCCMDISPIYCVFASTILYCVLLTSVYCGR